MTVVPNEWLVEWLAGSLDYQRRASRFLDKVEAAGDILAIRHASPFAQKLQRALKEPAARRLWLMLYNSTTVRLVDNEEVLPLPDDLLPHVPPDDLYLVELAYAVRPCTLVTTDNRLLEVLRDRDTQLHIRRPEDILDS